MAEENCTCQEHGWHGEGHSSACALMVIVAMEFRLVALEESRDALAAILENNLTAWEGEEDSVKAEHVALIEETNEALAKWRAEG